MRRRAILAALFFFVLLPARAQMALNLTSHCDHNWVISYGTNSFGLLQTTVSINAVPDGTYTTICFGPYWHVFHATIWPIAAVLIFSFVCLLWLAIYGIGLKSRARAKRPRPDPAPPP